VKRQPRISDVVVGDAADRRASAGSRGAANRRVLLVSPPFCRAVGYLQATFPLGLGYLAAVLDADGFDVAIYNAEIDHALDSNDSYAFTFQNSFRLMADFWKDAGHPIWREIEMVVRAFDPAIVGVSVMSNKSDIASRIAAIAKAVNPSIVTVAGGYHPTLCPDFSGGFDCALRGEAEHSFLALARTLVAAPSDLAAAAVAAALDRPVRLEELPHPARHLTLGHDDYPRAGMGIVMTSRGCPYSCSYCSSPTFYGRRVRYRPVDDVLDEMADVRQRYEVREIYLADDSFTVDKARVRAFCDGLRARDLDIEWSCITRLDLVDSATASLLKSAGCNSVWLGVESGSQRILDMVGKRLTLERIREAVQVFRDANLPWSGFFMVGLPGESVDEMRRTVDLMEELQPTYAEINIFNPLPGTELYGLLQREGRLDDDERWSLRSQASLRNLAATDAEAADAVLDIARRFDEHNAAQRAKTAAESPVRLYNQASHLEREGRLREAQLLFRKVLAGTRDRDLRAGAWYHLGCIERHDRNPERALEYFRQTLMLNPGHRAAALAAAGGSDAR
jgi:anaerobic magnesium-protoporphyrin IX monomethyl ester cyclase